MTELEKAYDHTKVEEKIYQQWLDSGFFNPDNLEGEPYTIILPPPNVTGTLHVGHALTATIQDILIRYKRMNGYKTLWLPGTDHAAIATQSKVEKLLEKEEGKKKRDLGREEFLKRVEKFASESHDTIVSQLKSMGASLDWSREAFTLDEKRNLAVRTAFKTMYDLGLIYRGHRVINWDVKGQTTISDDEIVYQERAAKLYTFKYGKDFPIAISSTRPETKIGDTAVAVHPDDERYAEYVGKEYDLEFAGVPIHIKIVADKSVEKDFGTGALGVTPAHSMVDYEIAQRHNLPLVQVINEFGKMTVGGENILNKKTEEARAAVVQWLRDENLLEKEEDIKQNIATAERTGGVIEPLPKLQWFISVDKRFKIKDSGLKNIAAGQETSLKELMRSVVESGEVKIIPDRFEKTYFHWIDNLRDWCISRQIWYGHRIPVWYDKEGNTHLQKERKIIFVRHGESLGNEQNVYEGQLDNPLTKKGLQQAKDTAGTLKNIKSATIISSDLQRAKQTAEIIAEHLGIKETSFHPEFREVKGGKFEGATRKKDFPLLIRILTEGGGEKLEEVVERAKKAWEIIEAHKSDGPVIIVGHNSFLPVIKAVQEGITTAQGLIDYRKKWKMENAGVYEFSVLTDPQDENLTQDEDTLDTWFSSGLWTFSTLGWPEQTKDLQTFHPTDVLETGYDILFFWVARMVLMTTTLTGQVPFKNVFLHGIIRDANREKMSKSKGNVIDPLDMTAKYGTDALRFALIFNTAPGTDMAMAEDKIKGMKHFGNKLWNIARFILGNADISNLEPSTLNLEPKTEADKDILAKLETLIKSSTEHIDNFRLHEAAQEIYHFVWKEFADIYIEASKAQLKDDTLKQNTLYTLYFILYTSLKLLHPFMPFVTEEIWSKLNQKDLLLITKWPAQEK
jgi:valyl-tRNA synthetase